MHHLFLFATLAGLVAPVLALWGHLPAPLQALILTGACALVVKYAPLLPGPTQRFFTWLNALIAHVGSPIVRGLLVRLDDAARTAVLWGEQTLISSIQARVVSGTLAPDQLPLALAATKAQVIERAKSYLSAQGILKLIVLLVFDGDASAFGSFLGDRVEAHVGTLPPAGLKAAAQAAQVKASAKAAAVASVPQVPAAG